MNKKTVAIDEDAFDFGFFTVSEEELAQREKDAEARAMAEAENILKQQQEEASASVNEALDTAQEYKARLDTLHKLIIPLLLNLSKDDDKPYIYWPERKSKVNQFMAKVNAIVNG